VPDVVPVERLIPLSAELLLPQTCPDVPRQGTNETLLDWAASCANAARLANDQIMQIRKLQP